MLINKETNFNIVLTGQEAFDIVNEIDAMLSICTNDNVFDLNTIETTVTFKNNLALKLFNRQ